MGGIWEEAGRGDIRVVHIGLMHPEGFARSGHSGRSRSGRDGDGET